MSIFGDALTQHFESLKTVAGDPFTYARGDLSFSVDAVIGQTIFEDTEADGVRIETKVVDFLISPDEMVINGEAIEPNRGDRIIKANGEVYEVMPGGPGISWRWSEGRQTHYRVHTTRRTK